MDRHFLFLIIVHHIFQSTLFPIQQKKKKKKNRIVKTAGKRGAWFSYLHLQKRSKAWFFEVFVGEEKKSTWVTHVEVERVKEKKQTEEVPILHIFFSLSDLCVGQMAEKQQHRPCVLSGCFWRLKTKAVAETEAKRKEKKKRKKELQQFQLSMIWLAPASTVGPILIPSYTSYTSPTSKPIFKLKLANFLYFPNSPAHPYKNVILCFLINGNKILLEK